MELIIYWERLTNMDNNIYTNLANAYLDANPEELLAGKSWYSDARAVIATLANEVGTDDITFAAVVAALSPRIRWDTNLDAATRIFRASVNGEPEPVVAGFGHNRRIAWDIANGGSLDLITGPKTMAFFNNLIDNEQAVTVDIWMYRAAGVYADNNGNREAIRNAIVEIAKDTDLTPAQIQAIIWITIRDRWSGD